MVREDDLIKDKYKVLTMIGRGGMSKVWLIERVADHSIWAMKEIDKSTKEFKAMSNADGTLTEIEIIKSLSHPSTPRVIDVFEDEESIQVFMEYIDGKSLKYHLDDRGPFEPEEAARYALEVCELFIYLHTRPVPVIYRDLKASNIMLNYNGNIRLIDFGIAVYKNTRTKYRPLGTKGYASPEHYKGIVDERSDIYTIGVFLFNLLTGINPSKVKLDEYLPEHAESIPNALFDIIQKATQKAPEDRYQSVSTLLNDLSYFLLPPDQRGLKGLFNKFSSRKDGQRK